MPGTAKTSHATYNAVKPHDCISKCRINGSVTFLVQKIKFLYVYRGFIDIAMLFKVHEGYIRH
ncbi:MAG: hypothetical protein J6Q11_07465 [Fibrobacteraceae bacterium]|nr:hypothetical protein [Fibrobacteraceae bacterium]